MDSEIEQKLLTFFRTFPSKSYKKNQVFLSPNKKPEGVYLLTKGTVRMFSLSKDGTELSLNIFKPLSFFPMGWALNVSPNNFYFDSLTDVTVFIAPKEKTIQFLKQQPEVVWDLMKRIYKGFDGYFKEMESLLEGKAYEKIITQLVIQTKRSNEHIHLTHNQLATLTGLSRETVTRELKKLTNKGLITREDKHLKIVNSKLLEEELR